MYLIDEGQLIVLSYLAIFKLNVANAADSVNSLHEISAKEALPFILFGTTQNESLQKPSRLIKAEIKDGRLASGTRFQAQSSDSQMFFCPKQDDFQKCLLPKQFEKSQVLECEAEPKPILEMSPQIHFRYVPCGATGNHFRMRFVYKICDAEKPYTYSTKNVIIYSICYDLSTDNVLFAYHMISDAAMLSEKLLTREKQIAFEMNTETYELINDTYYTKLKAEAKSKPKYKLQQLVPSDDMALAWWIKPTHHFTNFALQHEDLIEPWNHIRSLIRTLAPQPLDRPIGIITGAFDIPENKITIPVNENQKNSIWIVIVIDDNDENNEKRLAIVMNNFIAIRPKKHDDADGEASNTKIQYIDELCDGEDLSADSLKQVFNKVGGEVRCCEVTYDIMRLILPEAHLSFQLLHIPNLTKSPPLE